MQEFPGNVENTIFKVDFKPEDNRRKSVNLPNKLKVDNEDVFLGYRDVNLNLSSKDEPEVNYKEFDLAESEDEEAGEKVEHVSVFSSSNQDPLEAENMHANQIASNKTKDIEHIIVTGSTLIPTTLDIEEEIKLGSDEEDSQDEGEGNSHNKPDFSKLVSSEIEKNNKTNQIEANDDVLSINQSENSEGSDDNDQDSNLDHDDHNDHIKDTENQNFEESKQNDQDTDIDKDESPEKQILHDEKDIEKKSDFEQSDSHQKNILEEDDKKSDKKQADSLKSDKSIENKENDDKSDTEKANSSEKERFEDINDKGEKSDVEQADSIGNEKTQENGEEICRELTDSPENEEFEDIKDNDDKSYSEKPESHENKNSEENIEISDIEQIDSHKDEKSEENKENGKISNTEQANCSKNQTSNDESIDTPKISTQDPQNFSDTPSQANIDKPEYKISSESKSTLSKNDQFDMPPVQSSSDDQNNKNSNSYNIKTSSNKLQIFN